MLSVGELGIASEAYISVLLIRPDCLFAAIGRISLVFFFRNRTLEHGDIIVSVGDLHSDSTDVS